MYSKVLVLFAFTILVVNAQLITTKRIKSSRTNTIKIPKNVPLNLQMINQCNCPMEQPRSPKCPCGCANPSDCRGPIINSFGCPERQCKCGSCKMGQCRCPEPIIDTAYTFLPELPITVPVTLPFPAVFDVPFDYSLLSCGCQGPCQCAEPKIDPNYSPIITESYLTPDLSTYRVAPINVPTFLVSPSCLPCGCRESCNCRSLNPVFEIFAPVQECPAQLSCGCSRSCNCIPNVSTRAIDIPVCPKELPSCSCGLPSCGCAAPLPQVGCPKYLRQVTIQPPFL